MSEKSALIHEGFPDALADLVSRNIGSASPDLDKFYELIDDSDYSLNDWVDALIGFDQWLTQQEKAARPFDMMVGYINCCTVPNSVNISLPSLNVIVYKALTEFGFEFVVTSQ